jgi:hypothetical protein
MDRSLEPDRKIRRASPGAIVPWVAELGLLRTDKIKKAARRMPRCESQKCLNPLYHIFLRLDVKLQERKRIRFRSSRPPGAMSNRLQTEVSICQARHEERLGHLSGYSGTLLSRVGLASS